MTEAKADRAETAGRVWIADDDRSIRWVLNKALNREGIQCRAFETGEALLQALKTCPDEERPQALVSDVRMPGTSGLELLPQIKAIAPNLPVIIMTAFTDLDSAVSSFQKGAFEYLTKPFDVPKAVELIKRAITENQSQEECVPERCTAELAPKSEVNAEEEIPLIGQAPAMQEIFRAIGRLSLSTATVLLTGESGTGKEVVARTIWKHSPRSHAPFVAINVAAIPRELLESELFGHEKGAFTGAIATYQGRFEQAKGATLFLDEIGDMPMGLQTRLLRVLSSGYFYRVGGRTAIKSDVRIIAATNKELFRLVERGEFREDLFYRLNVIHLKLPPLRCRKEDIVSLMNYFLYKIGNKLNLPYKTLTKGAQSKIQNYSFPGNVRELENLCQWLMVMVPTRIIDVKDLPENINNHDCSSVLTNDINLLIKRWIVQLMSMDGNNGNLWKRIIAEVENEIIECALEKYDGNKTKAALFLGIGRNSLSRKKRSFRG